MVELEPCWHCKMVRGNGVLIIICGSGNYNGCQETKNQFHNFNICLTILNKKRTNTDAVLCVVEWFHDEKFLWFETPKILFCFLVAC